MLIRIIISGMIVLIFATVGFTQTSQAVQNLQIYQDSVKLALSRISFNKSKQAKEHHLYLDKGWQNSAVITRDDQILYFSGRFNVLNNAIEMKWEDEVKLVYSRKVKAALIGSDMFIPARGSQYDQPTANGYLQVVVSGPVNLLKRYFLSSKMEGGDGLTQQITGQKKYYIDSAYYYSEGLQSFSELKTSKKHILALFEEESEPMASFIKTHKLKLSKEEDLIRVFEHYNSTVLGQ